MAQTARFASRGWGLLLAARPPRDMGGGVHGKGGDAVGRTFNIDSCWIDNFPDPISDSSRMTCELVVRDELAKVTVPTQKLRVPCSTCVLTSFYKHAVPTNYGDRRPACLFCLHRPAHSASSSLSVSLCLSLSLSLSISISISLSLAGYSQPQGLVPHWQEAAV